MFTETFLLGNLDESIPKIVEAILSFNGTGKTVQI